MESAEFELNTATIGKLACGCQFDRDGTHIVGTWLHCHHHGTQARVTASELTTASGGLTAS